MNCPWCFSFENKDKSKSGFCVNKGKQLTYGAKSHPLVGQYACGKTKVVSDCHQPAAIRLQSARMQVIGREFGWRCVVVAGNCSRHLPGCENGRYSGFRYKGYLNWR